MFTTHSEGRESGSECYTLLRNMLSFSNRCSQSVQNMNAVRILSLIVDFRHFTQPYNLRNMNQAGLVHVLTLRLESDALLCYNFQ